MKIATIIGARPQFVKAAVLSRLIRKQPGMREIVIHTGQHYDENMSDVFFRELEIPQPDFSLGIGSGPHGAQTGRMLEAIENVLLDIRPDWVLVYGDTNSTLAGAIVAAKLHVPLAHVEAGMRSYTRMPEEINRVLTDHVSDLLLVSTQAAVDNLQREGIGGAKVELVGDIMYDAALYFGGKADEQSRILDKLELAARRYILATVHRAENTDDPSRLRAIFYGLGEIANELPIVLPLHPRTVAALNRERLLTSLPSGIRVIDPVGYLDMVMLEKHARLITTDSGGVQKEAFFYKVPCVTLRDETEWVESLEFGCNRLAPPATSDAVANCIREALDSQPSFIRVPYGDGHAGEKILAALRARNPQTPASGLLVAQG